MAHLPYERRRGTGFPLVRIVMAAKTSPWIHFAESEHRDFLRDTS